MDLAAREVGPSKIRSNPVRTPQNGTRKLGPGEVGVAPIGMSEIGGSEVRTAEVGLGENSTLEAGSLKMSSGRGGGFRLESGRPLCVHDVAMTSRGARASLCWIVAVGRVGGSQWFLGEDRAIQVESRSGCAMAVDSSPDVRLTDVHEYAMFEGLAPSAVYAFRERFIRAQSQRTWKLLRKELPVSRVVSREDACAMLEKAMTGLEVWVAPKVKKYSRLRWLWMLRRCPAFMFEGVLKTSAPYDWTLAEVLSGAAPERPGTMLLPDEQVVYRINSRVLQDFLELCEAARYLSDLHRVYRWAAKGAEIEFSPEESPDEHCDSALRRSAELYDFRREAARVPVNRLGTGDAASFALDAEGTDLFGVLAAEPKFHSWPADLLGVAAGSSELGGERSVYTRFVPCGLSSKDAIALGAIQSADDLALLWLLRCVAFQTYYHKAKWHGLATRGYLMFKRDVFDGLLSRVAAGESLGEQNIRRSFGLDDVASITQTLTTIAGRTWPLLAGPIVRFEGDAVCVDIATATKRFLAVQPALREGPAANERGNTFEHRVQALIDATAWRPPRVLAKLRRRTLRIAGRNITDIDAIGRRDDVILLVSCKSVVNTGDIDAGKHKAVRNAAELVEKAVSAWATKLDTLRATPVGDNYDFGPFAALLGVVCTPQPVWVPLGEATEEITEGLRAASSSTELGLWLSRGER